MQRTLLFLTALFVLGYSQAQVPLSDSARNDSLQLTQDLVIHQQQRRLDSMIKLRLQTEMAKLADDSKEKQQLQKQLRQIAINDSLRTAEQQQKIARLRQTATGYPVVLLEDTLFYIYLRLGAFNPAERAAAISARISNLYADDFFSADSLQLVQNEDSYDIVYKRDVVLMTVTELDALFFNQTTRQLAAGYQNRIAAVVQENQRSNSLVNWLRRISLVLLAIAGVWLVITVIKRLFRLVSKKIIANKHRYFKGVRFKSFQLFDDREHLRFMLRLLGFIRFATILLALYLSLPLLFSIFPQTKDYTYTLLKWIISPAKAVLHSLVSYLPNLFTILVIYLFTRYTIKAIHFLACEIEKGDLHINGFYRDWAQPTFNIIRFLLYAFMVIIIFPYLPGSGSPAFQGVSVFLGILFSLGSSSAIANIVAGLVITYMRPFKIGDRVKIGEVTGDVLEKTMLVTRIRTIKNEEITVPNASVLSNYTTNYTTGAEHTGLIVHTTVTIGYDVPWKKVHRALTDAASRHPLLLNDPPPFVLQTGLEDFYVAYQVNAYTRHPAALAKINSELHQHIQDCCNEAGIEILSPHYRAMRDGNATTIPQEYLPKDDKAPVGPAAEANKNGG